MSQSRYQNRFYRRWVEKEDLVTQEIVVGETDIFVSAQKDVRDVAEKLARKFRGQIEEYIKEYPEFKTSYQPLEIDSEAPDIIKDMGYSSKLAGVGPMASVAGAITEFVGKRLLYKSGEIIVENGGDVFIESQKVRYVSIYAGESLLSKKLLIKINPDDTPLGICTSSGTVGHSFSFGKADACVIISKSTALADAVATAGCNRVKKKKDIKLALEFALSIKGVIGALIVLEKHFGSMGAVELV